MTLGEKQELFALLLPKLLNKAIELGYQMRLGHLMRCQDCPVGREDSCHKYKLAIDINLFKDGKYLTSTEDHRVLGEYWESLHPLCSWGGHFNDGNHYSITHGGRR